MGNNLSEPDSTTTSLSRRWSTSYLFSRRESSTQDIFSSQSTETEWTPVCDELRHLIPSEHQLDDFTDHFQIIQSLKNTLGSSQFEVKEVSSEQSFTSKRVLRIDDDQLESLLQDFCREANILSRLSHPNIVRLHGIYADMRYYWMTQQFCPGDTLVETIRTNPLPEQKVISIVIQLLKAVSFLHERNIVHRDIKPDNIKYHENNIVLTNFDRACHITEDQEFKDWVGTPPYMAPETTRVRTGAELKKIDVWAVGVVTFILLTGYLPFFGKNVKELMTEICQKKLIFPRSRDVSQDGRKFVCALLRRNISNRLSADKALYHEWIWGVQFFDRREFPTQEWLEEEDDTVSELARDVRDFGVPIRG